MEEVNWELILHRLDEVTRSQKISSQKLDIIQEQLSKLNTVEKSVDEVIVWKTKMEEKFSITELNDMKEWKGKMDEIVSLKQLEKIIVDHESLKTFKTQATMVWVVVQAIMGIIMALIGFF